MPDLTDHLQRRASAARAKVRPRATRAWLVLAVLVGLGAPLLLGASGWSERLDFPLATLGPDTPLRVQAEGGPLTARGSGGALQGEAFEVAAPGRAVVDKVTAPSEVALRVGLLYLVVVAGVLARAVHERLPEARWRNAGALLREAVQKPGTMHALFVAPVVFLGVYQLSGADPESSVLAFLAFQNGFFWQTVLHVRVGRLLGAESGVAP